jgi:hypothetical protein
LRLWHAAEGHPRSRSDAQGGREFAQRGKGAEGRLDYLGNDGGAGIGSGPGNTIGGGLALLDGDRVAVGLVGDSDFIQGSTAVWTAAHYRIPALLIVSNNHSHLNDELIQRRVAKQRGRTEENSWIGQRIDDPRVSITKIAQGYGAETIGRSRSWATSSRPLLGDWSSCGRVRSASSMSVWCPARRHVSRSTSPKPSNRRPPVVEPHRPVQGSSKSGFAGRPGAPSRGSSGPRRAFMTARPRRLRKAEDRAIVAQAVRPLLARSGRAVPRARTNASELHCDGARAAS